MAPTGEVFLALLGLNTPNPFPNHVGCSLKREFLNLRSQHTDTNRFPCGKQETLPLCDAPKRHQRELIDFEVTADWIDPDHGLRLFTTQQNHVVVGCHHDLVGGIRMGKDLIIGRAPRRSTVLDVAHMAGVVAQLA
jgi:hypothetical protein